MDTVPPVQITENGLPRFSDHFSLCVLHQNVYGTSDAFPAHDRIVKTNNTRRGWDPSHGHFAVLCTEWPTESQAIANLLAALNGLPGVTPDARLSIRDISFDWPFVVPMTHLALPPVRITGPLKRIRRMVEWFRKFRCSEHGDLYEYPASLVADIFYFDTYHRELVVIVDSPEWHTVGVLIGNIGENGGFSASRVPVGDALTVLLETSKMRNETQG